MISKDQKIKDVLTTRAYNCLRAVYGDITVGDLCDVFSRSQNNIRGIPNLGKVSFMQIKQVVESARNIQSNSESKIDEDVLMTSKLALYEDMLSLKEQNAMLQTQINGKNERMSAYMAMCKEYERDNEILRSKLNAALVELGSAIARKD